MEPSSPTSDIPPSPQPPEPLPPMSLMARLMNVFAAPGEAFDAVKNSPAAPSNWLVPALLLIVTGWLGGWLVLSQPSIRHQLSDLTDQAIQKQVDKGRLNEQQAEQARAAGEKWATLGPAVGGAVAPLFAGLLTPLIWGLFLWLIGTKVFKAEFGFQKALEVAGLANIISVLDGIVRTLLIIALGNVYASPSPMLLLKEFDPQKPLHAALGVFSIMTFWVLAVRAVGLARLSGARLSKAVLWVFGIWAVYTGFFFGLGQLAQALARRMSG